MASKSQWFGMLARETDGSAASFGKADISLMADGYSPRGGGYGGGSNTRHVDNPLVTHTVIGAGALIPSAAGTAVREAYACHYQFSNLTLEGVVYRPKDLGVTLGQQNVAGLTKGITTFAGYLLDQIEIFANEPPDAQQTMAGKPILFRRSRIRIDFDPFTAQVEWRSEGGFVLTHYFIANSEIDTRRHMAPEAAAQELRRIRRSSILPASLLLLAAQALREGRIKRGERLPGSGQGEASTTAFPESERPANEKTPGLPQPGASRFSNQSRNQRETGLSPRPDSKRACVKSQAHAGSRGRLLTEHRRHDTRPEDPPSFGLFAAGYS